MLFIFDFHKLGERGGFQFLTLLQDFGSGSKRDGRLAKSFLLLHPSEQFSAPCEPVRSLSQKVRPAHDDDDT